MAAGTAGIVVAERGTAYTAAPPPAPTTPSAPPMPIAPLPEPAAPEARATASRVPVRGRSRAEGGVPPARIEAGAGRETIPAAKPSPRPNVEPAAKPGSRARGQPQARAEAR